MKKILAMMLTAAMMLSMGTAAMAAEQDLSDVLDKSTSFEKEYVIKHGTAPAETFDFEIEKVSYKDNSDVLHTDDAETTEVNELDEYTFPVVTLGDAVFEADLSATDTADVTVDISDIDVGLGVYTYKITEVLGKTAGVTYVTTPVYLVVTILYNQTENKHYVAAIHLETEDGSKTGNIDNEYDAGDLTVTKNISGNIADMEKEFKFTITLTAAKGEVFNEKVQNVVDAVAAKTENAATKVEYNTDKNEVVITVWLGHEESINITNIPVGVTYTIVEDEDGYTKTNTSIADGTITGGDKDVSVWENTKGTTVDTGISVDSIPYIAMLGVVAVGGAGFMVSKKRRSED